MDQIVALPRSPRGNNSIWVFVDRFSKYVIAAPCPDTITSEQLAELFIQHVVQHHGVPLRITSDRDPLLAAKVWKYLATRLGIHMNMSTPRSPETDGLTEIHNKTLIQVFRTLAADASQRWDRNIPFYTFAVNDAVNITGFTAFQLSQGYDPASPTALIHNMEFDGVEKTELSIAEYTIRLRDAFIRAKANEDEQRPRVYAFANGNNADATRVRERGASVGEQGRGTRLLPKGEMVQALRRSVRTRCKNKWGKTHTNCVCPRTPVFTTSCRQSS